MMLAKLIYFIFMEFFINLVNRPTKAEKELKKHFEDLEEEIRKDLENNENP